MLLLERLRLPLREKPFGGLAELQRRVAKVVMMMLLLLRLNRRRCLREYVAHHLIGDKVLRKGRRTVLLYEMLRRCLLMLVLSHKALRGVVDGLLL